ncbi:MAG: phage virion morphogenesis protein [Spirochaetaceae bacterium]|nr:phage virion morphogenesis protein [Spirochaetaceae bacterium]MBP3673517.1 phage virion morphogenesis protein [Oscillospiraceae bacterium]
MGVRIVKDLPRFGANLKGSVARVMPKIAAYLQSCANKKINRGVPPANAPLTAAVKQGNRTLRDTGALAASIAAHSGQTWADASTNLKYARIQQEGGTITGKGKGLWIPAGARTRQLMRQYSATSPGQLIKAMRGAKWRMWRSGRAWMAQKGRQAPFVLFIIKDKVQIPARPFLYIDRKEESYIMRIVQEAVFLSLKEDN